MPALNANLKKALIQLPSVEKDKLLLRLVAKDPVLVERLEFELVEQRSTVDERRDLIRQYIQRTARLGQDTPGWVMMDMRTVSGYITRHVKVTKDTYGEVELSLAMLNTFYDHNAHLLRTYNHRSDSAAQYIAKRTEQVLKKVAKLDPDYYVEFTDAVNKLLGWVHQSAPGHYARQLNLPREWNP